MYAVLEMGIEECFMMKSTTNSPSSYHFRCSFSGITQDTPRRWELTTMDGTTETPYEYHGCLEIEGVCLKVIVVCMYCSS